jgi:hypothetical protein
MVLCDKFSGRPGYELVKRKQYLFQDGANGRDLSVKLQFPSAVRPGQKIAMCMVLFSPEGQNNVCPKCGAVTITGSNMDVDWYISFLFPHPNFLQRQTLNTSSANPKCRMTYRRVTDTLNTSLLNIQNRLYPYSWEPFSLETTPDSETLESHDITTSFPDHLLDAPDPSNALDIFKRARLFTRWQDASESRARPLLFDFGGVSLWAAHGPASHVSTQIVRLIEHSVLSFPGGVHIFHSPSVINTPGGMLDYLDSEFVHFCAWGIYFLGTSRRNAKPILLFYSKHKILRQLALNTFRGLEWLDWRNSGVVTTTWHHPLFREGLIIDSQSVWGWDREFAERVW